MSNWVDIRVDVLVESSDELSDVAQALQEPCPELLAWYADRCGSTATEISGGVREVVSLRPQSTSMATLLDPDRARRFEGEWKDKFSGLGWSHLFLTSEHYPTAVFLVEYGDDQMGYSGRRVLRGGTVMKSTVDREQQDQGRDWVLLDIFAPFRAEHSLNVAAGSLWDQWLTQMQKNLDALKAA